MRRQVHDALQSALERAETRDRDQDFAAYKRILGQRERGSIDPDEVDASAWDRSDAGYPLGRGMPAGAPLRTDGETHRQAWMRILRADPCSYCGGAGGTVDHVIPVSSGSRDRHKWHNYAGACETCNGSKANKPLLEWLTQRRVLVAPSSSGPRPKRAAPAHVTLQSHSRTPAKDARRRREAAGLPPGRPRSGLDLGHLIGSGR